MELERDRQTPAGPSSGYILIAVANIVRARALKASLAALGRDIVSVRDGSDARREIVRETPALMLCDLSLPRIDGFDLVRELRQLAPRRRAAVIVMAPHAAMREAASRLAQTLGISEVLGSDVDPATLRRAVEGALCEETNVAAASPHAAGPHAARRPAAADATPQDPVERALFAAASRFKPALTAVYLRSEAGEDVRGYFAMSGASIALDAGQGLTFLRQLALASDTLIVPAAANHPALAELVPEGIPLAGGFAAAPVAAHGRGIRGTLCVLDTGPLDIGAADLDALEEIAGDLSRTLAEIPTAPTVVDPQPAAAQAVDIDSLERLASADPLTGLANRRGGERDISAEISRARRQSTPLSCVLLDIDHFKDVNDTFGHQAGDYVLREVSALLRRTVRAYDILARWGGEEFLVVLPGVQQPQALKLGERIRAAIENLPLSGIGNITASIGVASLGSDYSFDAMFNLADRRLYSAKSAGRNTVA